MAVAMISGSPMAPSRCTALLAHVAALLHKYGLDTRTLVVRDLPAEDILHGRSDSDVIKSAVELDDDIALRLQDGVRKFVSAAALPPRTSHEPQQLRPTSWRVTAAAI